MVNSGSFDSDGQGDRNAKVGFTQPHNGPDSTQSSSPVTASAATPCKTDFSQTADSDLPSVAHAIEPTPTKTEFNSDMPVEKFTNLSSIDGSSEESEKLSSSPSDDEKTSLCCSLPLEKVQGVLTPYHPPATKADDDGTRAKQPVRKLLCLYCDRSFVSANLRQKHVERIHSVRQNRRVSSRRQNQLTVTPCVYCDKLNGTENTLKDLFQHLINEHSSKYFGCLPCEDRFLTSSLLADHNASNHRSTRPAKNNKNLEKPSDNNTTAKTPSLDATGNLESEEEDEEIPVKITRSKMKPKSEEESDKRKKTIINKKKSTKLKQLRAKKLSVKSSRIALKRRESKRLQAIAKLAETQKKKRPKPAERKQSNINKTEQASSTKSTEKAKSNSTCINPYPEFDHFYRVKKITDHSIDNLKISSLTFDDVFDKAFFNRIKCNIEENLLHHIDGKLFKNEESENRISNFEKISSVPQEVQNTNSENYGCELSLNAVTPVASLSLNSQFGEDFESQIEYGSKPSKKKTQTRKDEVHYKYFTRRKYQASILEHKENRDLSKLDMWTQLVIKRRQQKMLDDKKSAKEILEYTTCDEYKNKIRREELNRILDRRGPFEDLKEEASKKAALDKLNLASADNISQESFTEVREVLNEILNRVFAATEDLYVEVEAMQESETRGDSKKQDVREIPDYLSLRRSSSLPSDGEIDKSDRIALICSSQETENFELPTNQVRAKNELIELTGEWARCRMYICAACGAKLPNMKFLLEHKSLYHQNVWVQHYEFVGNQSELYRHLSIPALGKVGAVEESVQCKVWRRSDARVCTKCGKQCNALAELHRHILECGGDWTWMLARKKCKYRPFGAKSRRKRRGLIHRIHHKRKTEPAEKKTYKKRFDGPRQRPSDADTIQRMLANLPAKRSTRKLISLYDGIYRARKNTQMQNINQQKVKCGKVIYKTSSRKETTEKTINTATTVKSPKKNNLSANRRSLRSLNKVLASRILDTNAKLTVKRKLKVLNEKRRTRQSQQKNEELKEPDEEQFGDLTVTSTNASGKPKLKGVKKENEPVESEATSKRTSPRSSPQNVKKKMTVKKLLTGNISIKSFFPVKKRKLRKDVVENQSVPEAPPETEDVDIKTRSKRKSKETCEAEDEKKEVLNVKAEPKKSKNDTFSNLIRSFSFHSKRNVKTTSQESSTEGISHKRRVMDEETKVTEEDKISKKRKLKRSFRSVISKVKKAKTDTAKDAMKSEELPLKPTNSTSPFLEESKREGLELPARVEKIIIPSTLEVKENIADISTAAPIVITFHESNENPPIPETIFQLESNNEKNLQAKGEPDFDYQLLRPTDANSSAIIEDTSISNTELTAVEKVEQTSKGSEEITGKTDKTQPISIETSVKPKIVPLISPNMKGKIRKPTRGLNDCIAMLTNKLQQKTVEETSSKVDSIVINSITPNSISKTPTEAISPKTECILRIPTFKTQKVYPEVEETALDLSTKSLNSENRKEEIARTATVTNVDMCHTLKQPLKAVPIELPQMNRVYNSVDKIIEEVVENRIQKYPTVLQSTWNSVDETIQKVVENAQCLASQLPSKNTIDEIIDFVVGYGNENCGINNIKIAAEDLNNVIKKPCRKIGSVRRAAGKKSRNESLKLGESVEDVSPKLLTHVLKEQILSSLVIAAAGRMFTEDLIPQCNSISTVKRTGSYKKKNVKKLIDEKTDIASKQNTMKVNTIEGGKLSIDNSFTVKSQSPNVENIDKNNVVLKETEGNLNFSSFDIGVGDNPVSDLNKAFISSHDVLNGKTGSLKGRKRPRKLGCIRSRSQPKKGAEHAQNPTEKILLETDIDALSDVKEIGADPSSPKEFTSPDLILTKESELKQLLNEDEPLLLENKLMTPQQKLHTLPSDSEDDIPLAALVKPEDNPKQDLVNNETLPPIIETNTDSVSLETVQENYFLENPSDVAYKEVITKGDHKSEETSLLEKHKEKRHLEDDANPDVDNQVTVRESELEDRIPAIIDISSINETCINHIEKGTVAKRSSNKKSQKRRSKSDRRRVSNSVPQPEIPGNNIKVNEKLIGSVTSLAEVWTDPNVLPNTIPDDLNFNNKTPKKKPRSVKINHLINSILPENQLCGETDVIMKDNTDVNLLTTNGTNPLLENKSKSTTEITEVDMFNTNVSRPTTPNENSNVNTSFTVMEEENLAEKTVYAEKESISLEESTTTGFKLSPTDKIHESSSDLDSDTPLTTIIAGKKTENVSALKKLNIDEQKKHITEIDEDSDIPLTMIIDEKNNAQKVRKRKSRSVKRKTNTNTSFTKKSNSLDKQTEKNDLPPNNKTDNDEHKHLNVENTISDFISESEMDAVHSSETIINEKLHQSDKNDHIESVIQKTDVKQFLEPTPKKSISKRSKALKKKVNTVSGESMFTNSQIQDYLVVNLDTNAIEGSLKTTDGSMKLLEDITPSNKQKKKGMKQKQNDSIANEESSSSNFSDTATADEREEGNSLQLQVEFAPPKIGRVKPIRKRSRSIKSNNSTGDLSTDSVLSDSSLNSGELTEESKDKSLEILPLFMTPINLNKRRSRPKRNHILPPKENVDMSISTENEIEGLISPQLENNSKKSAGRKSLDNTSNLIKVVDNYKGAIDTFDGNFSTDNEKMMGKDNNLTSNLAPLPTTYVTDSIVLEDNTDFIKPDVSTKSKRSRSLKKELTMDSVDGLSVGTQHIGPQSSPKKLNQKMSQSIKDESTNKVEQLAVTANAINVLLTKISDDPVVDLEVKSKKKGRSKSLTNTLHKEKALLDIANISLLTTICTDNIFRNCPDGISADNIELNFKRRQSLRKSQKEKNKESQTKAPIGGEEESSNVILSKSIDLSSNTVSEHAISDNTLGSQVNKNDFSIKTPPEEILEPTVPIDICVNANITDENASELGETPMSAFQEPPIKIIINKQKTRRKSKSFKKVDLKGQNDLFEDFALVIKKPKRIIPIVTYSPADSFAKDMYPKYIKQSIEQPPSPLSLPPISLPLPLPSSILSPEENKEETIEDLDASVEEMDMELDEIPIVSNIIERDTSSFTNSPAVTNIFTKQSIDIPKTVPVLEPINEKQINKKMGKNSRNKTFRDTPIEEVGQVINITENPIMERVLQIQYPPLPEKLAATPLTNRAGDIKDITEDVNHLREKDVLLNTDEEFLYETGRPTRNRNTDIKTSKKAKSKLKNRGLLDESLEIAQEIHKFELESDKLSELIKNDVIDKNSTIINATESSSENANVTVNISDIVADEIQTNVRTSTLISKTSNELNKLTTEEKDEIDLQKSDSTENAEANLNFNDDNKCKRNKKKKTKYSICETRLLEDAPSINLSTSVVNKATLNKEKDIESIYTFTELEDLEIEKPIEIPRRTSRKQQRMPLEPESQFVQENNITYTDIPDEDCDVSVMPNVDDPLSDHNKESTVIIDEPTIKSLGKRRSRSTRDVLSQLNSGGKESTGEIKENNIELLENGRRKSVRSAKVKALEHIHDDALAELTESERNRDLSKDKIVPSEDNVTAVDEITKKKSTRRQSRAQRAQEILESNEQPKENAEKYPLVDDLEELDKNIEMEFEKGKDYTSYQDVNVLNDSNSKQPSRRQTTDGKMGKATEDVKQPLIVTLENVLSNTEKEIEDKQILPDKFTVVSNTVTKKKGIKKQCKSQKPQKSLDNFELPKDIDKPTVTDPIEKESLNIESDIMKETTVSEGNNISLGKKKPNRKTKAQKGQKPLTIPHLSNCDAETHTLITDTLTDLEKTIESELDQGKSSTEEVVVEAEQLNNKSLNNKNEQNQKNQKLLDNFDSSSEIAQKCAELIDFADNIAGLEDLENSIERELNLELEDRKKRKRSKSKQPSELVEPPEESNHEENMKSDFLLEDGFQELRRSRRGSRKITSYNENDLIDPLLDAIDGKRKSRKKEKSEENVADSKINKKSKESDKKLNNDELFDLLKASTNEPSSVPKTSSSFLNNLGEDSSRGFNDDNFDNVFENILEKTFLMQNTASNKSKEGNNHHKIYEFTESPENTEQVRDNQLPLEATCKTTKKPPRRNTLSLKSQTDENSESTFQGSSLDNIFPGPNVLDSRDSSVDSKNKHVKGDKTDSPSKSNYCEICNKSFIRVENLNKHKRTLTHIQKLSEIEAKEAAEKSKLVHNENEASEPPFTQVTTETSKAIGDISRNEINISDILQESNKPNGQESPMVHSSFANNHSLKLADIINDVLNKPVLEGDMEKCNSFSDIIMQNNAEAQPEYRRYKSLGERKSFDSEPTDPPSLPLTEPYISKTTILEKQISLLENIIENQTGVNYIDDISMSSNNSLENNTRESPSELSLKQDDSSNMPFTTNNSMKPTNNDDSFLKPSQYEEISEDSVNLRNYEDQKLRKTLNRDEELFLECCSLLKSGSEVSNYSNKKSHAKIMSNMGLRQCDEPEWLERKSLVQKPLYDIANEYSDDNSRIPTPLGDSYDDDASNSNTISSNWNMNKKAPGFEDNQQTANKSFSFEEVLNECVTDSREGNKNTLKFGGVLNQPDYDMSSKEINREPIIEIYDDEPPEQKQEDCSDGPITDSKKIITKGARKVFEGLKVSIPTEELNLDEVLNCSPKQKKIDMQNPLDSIKLSEEPTSPPIKPSRTARKSKPVKNKSQIGSNVLFKMNKKKVLSPTSTKKKDDDLKAHDIYDFEETQDNTDVFTKPDFKTFRNMKSNDPLPEPESDTESRDYLDSFSVGAQSLTSSISSSSSKKPKTQENITKKKCMIMGRIFKNQAKSKLDDIDEEMRNIPEIDNGRLVENYVADCKKIIRNEDVAKPKLSEKEINLLFDQLLENKFDNKMAPPGDTKSTSKPKPEVKKADNKKKVKPKNRKRARTNSDSTDDEFNINKVTKKRAYRKNGKAEDNCINLEQELKECIGVASRKSQRKCTSGKQNVLVEYWSSDESQFETLLETQRIEPKHNGEIIEESKEAQEIETVSEPPPVSMEENTVEVLEAIIEVSEKPHKPKSIEKKQQQKRKSINENKPKSGISGKAIDMVASNRRKRAAANPLYHWSSSSEDEAQDLIEVKPIRDEIEDDEDRPIQHGWIVGDSPKKLVTMLAQAKGKKTDIDCVKEQGKKRTNAVS